MDYKTAALMSSYLAKDYSEDFFILLVNYQDISASEAASPYYRYNLTTTKLKLEVDLGAFKKEDPGEGLERLVREKKNNGANYSVARSGDCFSSVTIWEGEGREREVHNINLTTSQGKFLFHLPFPQARPISIAEVMEKASIELTYSAEIQDIVDELARLGVIDFV
jgi:hypothetical protein